VTVNPEQLERARAALNILVERFPRAFTSPPRPLKIGITKDLIAAARSDAISAQAIRDAIAIWCRRPSYLEAQVEDAARIDIDGNPTGTVTADQAAGVKQRLEWKAAQASERALEKESARKAEQEAKVAARSKQAAAKVLGEKPKREVNPKREVIVERKPAASRRGAIRSWRGDK
jgi:ProP effector